MDSKMLVPEDEFFHSHILPYEKLFFYLRMTSHIPVLFFIHGKIWGTETFDGIILPSELELPFLQDPAIAKWLHSNALPCPSIQEETASIYYCTKKYADNITCIIGPLYTDFLSKTELRSYMRRHNMHNFQNYHIRPASHQEAYALISLVDYFITGKVSSAPEADSNAHEGGNPVREIPAELSSYLLQSYRLGSEQHIPYHYEQQMFEYVKQGDYESFLNFTTKQMPLSNYSLGKVSHNELKQREYFAVTQIALFRQAAIESGVNPYDVYDLSDMLLQRLSEKQTVENYEKVQMDCIRLFFDAVRKARNISNSSVHIKKCKYYISKNLRSHFTISDIAGYVGLSPNYLGNLFREHESCTLKHYIIRERVNCAKNMLKYSDFTISDIAASLCFQNQSHFGALFRKETGLTPGQYRKMNKPQNF